MLRSIVAVAALAATLAGCALGAPSDPPTTHTPAGDVRATMPPESTPTPEAESPEASGDDGPYLPKVGDCFDVRKDEPDLRDSLVSCDDEHDDEVYAEFDLPDSDYPGESAVLEAADAGCVERFASFVGVPYETSALEVTTYQPSAEAWAAGERRVTCIVWHPSTSVVGSLEGAAI